MKLNNLTESLSKKYSISEEAQLRSFIDSCLITLTEANMSDQDKHDSDILRQIRSKIDGKKFNMKNLSDEEKEVLDRLGYDTWGYKGETKTVSPGHNDIVKGHEQGKFFGLRKGVSNDLTNSKSYDKANLADRGRKLDARDKDQDIAQYQYHYDVNNYQQANRKYDADKMQSKYNDMKHLLDNRKRYQELADNAVGEYENSLDNIYKDYYTEVNTANDRLSRDLDHFKERRNDAQNDIDSILHKHKKAREALFYRIKLTLSRLNEANMSPEDKHDSDLLRSVMNKLHKRSNARLTPEEENVIDKYGLARDYNRLRLSNGTPLDSTSSWKDVNSYDNINFADKARKKVQRYEKNLDTIGSGYFENPETEFERKFERNRHGLEGRKDIYNTKQDAYQHQQMGKDVDHMKTALHRRKDAIIARDISLANHENSIKKSTDRRDARLRGAENTYNYQRSGKDKVKEINNQIQDLLTKKESLEEAVGSNERVVETGLGPKGYDIIDSIIGQMSDGIWENSRSMEKYWSSAKPDMNGNIIVDADANFGTHFSPNPWYDMSDQEIRRYFANKLKTIVQMYLNDNNENPYKNWNGANDEECDYMANGITVGDCYNAYKILKK